ncbi:phage antirepressor Ant [Clostridium botulinum C/D]|nr:phage antirepressor Ant [Clostridium botulinum C/D]NFQ88162.1 phage antirepressor Ant [Clostridium botulinum]MCD3209798.1 phage antirepressor Ant [Clostridium botulinum C/D]MCD3212852.1 phage antirepressor Ant [Clostridium botulinum C/D]MCD3223518.1 phage antirepressor Ant [Clostridium botulinum C/D]
MGCEFLANKFNGEKGILFTAKYVERFNEMEEKQNQFKLPHTYKEALLQLVEQVEENEKLNTVIEDMTPKAIIGDTFTSTANAYDMGVFSKVLSINGLGRNNMFQWLRDKKILMKGNTPFQRYNKYFKVVMVTNSFGFANPKTLINPKGVEFIVKKLIEDEYIITKSIDEILKELNSKEDYAIIL